MQYKAQGVSTSDRYLRVFFTVEVGQTMRFAEVKVPMFMLLTDQVARALDKEVRRQIKADLEGWEDLRLFE